MRAVTIRVFLVEDMKLGADAVFLKSEMREFMDYCSELGGVAAAAR